MLCICMIYHRNSEVKIIRNNDVTELLVEKDNVTLILLMQLRGSAKMFVAECLIFLM